MNVLYSATLALLVFISAQSFAENKEVFAV